MFKKGLLVVGALAIAIAAAPLFAAFEAHIINVTARIENALAVHPEEIAFGTVFPQEHLEEPLTIAMSESFNKEPRVDDISYNIKQKPKPRSPEEPIDGQPAWEYCHQSWDNAWVGFEICAADIGGSFIEKWEACKYVLYKAPPTGYDRVNCYPYLCPFLSKIPVREEPGDSGVRAPHFPDGTASGYLSKSAEDFSDDWIIDLVVPCFQGQCAQDYNWWEYGPPLPGEELEGEEFGCDLWIEVTGISER